MSKVRLNGLVRFTLNREMGTLQCNIRRKLKSEWGYFSGGGSFDPNEPCPNDRVEVVDI